jgi:release factor glutamine methyltransferase
MNHRNLSLKHHPQIYPVREDTLLLCEAALEEVKVWDRVLEVGTGSGYITKQLNAKAAWIVATDINPYAVAATYAEGIDVVRTDLTAGICGLFDVVIFNPPYLPTVKEERIEDWLEYALDGGPTGRKVIERFAREVGTILTEGGRVLLLVSSLTGKKEVRDIFIRNGFSGEIVREIVIEAEELLVYRFLAGKPCLNL